MMRNKRKHRDATLPFKHVVLWVQEQGRDTWIKCNVDGAFIQESKKGATGAVLRDHKGSFFSGQCMDAITTEALACRDSLLLGAHRGVTRVHMETDYPEFVRLWDMKDEQRSPIIWCCQRRYML